MFTGLIEEVGDVVELRWPDADRRDAHLRIRAARVTDGVAEGDSIAVNGVCLTVTEFGDGIFGADVMPQTIDVTTIGKLKVGSRVNLERALAVGDRLGGHIVQGHVDGTGTLISRAPGERWDVLAITLPDEIAPYVAGKGSIAVNGVSLTVANVGADRFEVSLIPETLARTNLGGLAVGDAVNLETDVLARHVATLMEARN
ncbi:riboflavin synthase [Rarobacter incanus]|uniref:Riboflavin synthase n=1 Tax=Rarobacter incanus TaxID=153494 RepID=A0A542SLZ8_9MICO|nr:riboflavin synthase [Rarobacter incanus]TQK75660.1 riboflavin synthase alpha chain [Rarobacter incanus]